jgi:hypothetical protein
LIPYPYAGDHQRHNAHSLERRGATLTLLADQVTPERIALVIRELSASHGELERMGHAARALGRPDAARNIARDLLAFSGISGAGLERDGEADLGPKSAPSAEKLRGPSDGSASIRLGEVA